MITVQVIHTLGLKDEAEAETPEDAIFAARTLYDEMCDARPYQGWHKGLITIFSVNDEIVRSYCDGVRP